MGKLISGFILMAALIAGIAIYYLQVYGFYEDVKVAPGTAVSLTLLETGQPDPIITDDFKAIDGTSSPIRYRACFTTSQSTAMMTETYTLYDHAEPLTGPNWFDCYNASEIGEALEKGTALAFLAKKDVADGVDRVVAIMEDGRGFVWHQLNEKYAE
ncbi:MAG: DUF6446 family protein [Halocynthiibacter sp.]